jgi:hypothetical protein
MSALLSFVLFVPALALGLVGWAGDVPFLLVASTAIVTGLLFRAVRPHAVVALAVSPLLAPIALGVVRGVSAYGDDAVPAAASAADPADLGPVAREVPTRGAAAPVSVREAWVADSFDLAEDATRTVLVRIWGPRAGTEAQRAPGEEGA